MTKPRLTPKQREIMAQLKKRGMEGMTYDELVGNSRDWHSLKRLEKRGLVYLIKSNLVIACPKGGGLIEWRHATHASDTGHRWVCDDALREYLGRPVDLVRLVPQRWGGQ